MEKYSERTVKKPERSFHQNFEQGMDAAHVCIHPDLRVIGDDLIKSAHDHPCHDVSGNDLLFVERRVAALEQEPVDLGQDHGEKEIADALFAKGKGDLAGIILVV